MTLRHQGKKSSKHEKLGRINKATKKMYHARRDVNENCLECFEYLVQFIVVFTCFESEACKQLNNPSIF